MPRRREASTNALNFSGSVLIEAGDVIETREHAGDFKVCEARQNKKPPRGETVTADCEMLLVLLGQTRLLGIVDHLRRRFVR
jgi:hypothetical protein